MKLKICFYINNLGKGGAERVITELAHQFNKKLYDVVVVTSFRDRNEYILDPAVKRICLEETQDFGNRIARNVKLIRKLRHTIKTEKPDVVISFMQEPNFRAIIATAGLKTKRIISVRNDPEKEYFGKLGRFVGKVVLPFADGCVFQTEEAKKWFPKRLQTKSTIIFNEVKEQFFKTEYSPGKRIITVGRLNKQKNHELLIDAFSKIANEVLDRNVYIYGEGPLRDKLQEKIDSFGLSNRIFLMGTTNNVAEVLSTSEVFVLCSDYEGMPNALLEALAVGVPSISTDCPCGGPRMIIQNKSNGLLVKVGDADSLADALRSLINDNDFKTVISKNARETATKYKPQTIFAEWEDYIRYIAEE